MRRSSLAPLLLMACALLMGCSRLLGFDDYELGDAAVEEDSGLDGGDAARDVGADAPFDVGVDAPRDAGTDAPLVDATLPPDIAAIQVALGRAHTCVRRTTDVLCWGDGAGGRLGNGSTSSLDAPGEPVDFDSFDLSRTRLVAGGVNTCIYDPGDVAYCWGRNDRGELGADATIGSDNATPVRIEMFTGLASLPLGPTEVAIGHGVICFLDAISAGDCPSARGSSVICGGINEQGQLGNGVTGGSGALDCTDTLRGPSNMVGWNEHFCAVDADDVFCWGNNGQNRINVTPTARFPSPTTATSASGVAAIAVGNAFTCQLTGAGRVHCFGENGAMQLADGRTADRAELGAPIDFGGTGVTMRRIVAGDAHACALDLMGGVHCWGNNGSGQAGTGEMSSTAPPTLVSLPHRASDIDAGGAHTCAVLETGRVYCWGNNRDGQLGVGSRETAVPTPTEVILPPMF